MKYLIVCLAIAAAALAAPQQQKLKFRNLYRDPVPGAKPAPAAPRIIGGQEVDPHSIPHQAFLEVLSLSGGWYCGGVLISPNYVLTAGHCTYEGLSATITLGAHRVLESETEQLILSSSKLIVHEGFDYNNILNDIGLVQLSQTVEYNANIAPIRLADDDTVDFAGETIKVSGWGLTDGFGSELSEVLNSVENPVITNQECNDVFGVVEDYTVCMSGEGGRSSCNGDSGGPASVGDVLVGVVSYGISYCLSGYPSAYTRVSSFIDWIKTNSDYE